MKNSKSIEETKILCIFPHDFLDVTYVVFIKLLGCKVINVFFINERL